MLDVLYHLFNFTISGCYFIIFGLIFNGLIREKVFFSNRLGTATCGIFLTCALGHLVHASTSHVANSVWEAGLQVFVDGLTVIPAVIYVILRGKYGLLIRGPDMISEYKAQLANQQAELKALRDYEKLKDDFLEMAGHELRTPLTSIKGYAQVLTKEFGKSDNKRMLVAVQTINRQSDRMSQLVMTLLDVSRLQSRKFETTLVPLNIAKLTTEIAQTLQVAYPDHELKLDIPADPVWVEADAGGLEQVINNLVSNAVKYSPDSQQVDLTLEVGKKEVLFHVKDCGLGISSEELPKIFERFYRSTGVRNSTKMGLGLGLYISNEIIHANKGEITVVSQLGQGSTFSVKLPRLLEAEKIKSAPELNDASQSLI